MRKSPGALHTEITEYTEVKKRILLEFGLDIGRELEVRQLQQFDSLLQLRRHDERLRLPEVQPLRECHVKLL